MRNDYDDLMNNSDSTINNIKTNIPNPQNIGSLLSPQLE